MFPRLKYIGKFGAIIMLASHALASSPEPYHLVRALMSLEQRAVQGETSALTQRREFVRQIDRILAQTDPSVWKRPENISALAIYLLSGGSPTLARGIDLPDNTPEEMRKILAGAVAYSRGDRKSAKTMFSSINLRRVEPLIAGSLGIAIASIKLTEDVVGARRILEDVELLAPGTIYEETALRRQVMALDGRSQFGLFAELVHRYETRFPHSPYAADFRIQVREVVQNVLFGVSEFEDGQLATILNVFPRTERYERLLSVASEAIASGKPDVSAWLSSYLCRNAEAGAATRSAAAQYFLLAGLTANQKSRWPPCPDIDGAPAPSGAAGLTRTLYHQVHKHIQSWAAGGPPAERELQGKSPWEGSEEIGKLVEQGNLSIAKATTAREGMRSGI